MAPASTTAINIGFVGAGTVGTVLAESLTRAGHRVSKVASRTRASADALADSIAGCESVAGATEVAEECDLVFLTVPDDAIGDVAAGVQWRPGMAVVHCSGATSLEALERASADGAAVGAFHPLQTFADPEIGLATLPGSSFGVEAADPELRATLHRMALELGCTAVDLQPEARALYHVSAVMASNHLVALIADAAGLWREFGFDRSSGLRALLPLIRGTVANLERQGLPAALTGPVARGDVGTVERNLGAVLERAPELADVHRAMNRRVLELAIEKGRISHDDAAEILALLQGGSAPGER